MDSLVLWIGILPICNHFAVVGFCFTCTCFLMWFWIYEALLKFFANGFFRDLDVLKASGNNIFPSLGIKLTR